MMTKRKTESPPERLLGGYLFALCLYQIGIYFWPSGPPFILDPRAGIPVLLINHFSFDNKVIHPVEWITATWLVIPRGDDFLSGKILETLPDPGNSSGCPNGLLYRRPCGSARRRFRAGV